jgi:hypothetical protein
MHRHPHQGWGRLEGPVLAQYNPGFAENPEWADFNIQPIFFVFRFPGTRPAPALE